MPSPTWPTVVTEMAGTILNSCGQSGNQCKSLKKQYPEKSMRFYHMRCSFWPKQGSLKEQWFSKWLRHYINSVYWLDKKFFLHRQHIWMRQDKAVCVKPCHGIPVPPNMSPLRTAARQSLALMQSEPKFGMWHEQYGEGGVKDNNGLFNLFINAQI